MRTATMMAAVTTFALSAAMSSGTALAEPSSAHAQAGNGAAARGVSGSGGTSAPAPRARGTGGATSPSESMTAKGAKRELGGAEAGRAGVRNPAALPR